MKSVYESPVFESDVVTKIASEIMKGKMSAESGAVGSGKKCERKKFESPKKLNFFPFELFSSILFLVHMEAEALQWQTTHLKACHDNML